MTNHCAPLVTYTCTALDIDNCKFSEGQRHNDRRCLYAEYRDDQVSLACTCRDAHMAALIALKGRMLK